MAILVTSQSHFKPLSFDEMLKPYAMATEEYRNLEAGIVDLESQAEAVRQQALAEPEGSKARIQYETYAANLAKQAETLASQGLKAVNRKSLYDLASQYKSSIKPIEDIIKYRKDISEEQRKAKLANPNLIFDTDFSGVSLDYLLDNPNLGYNAYDLNDYAKRGAIVGASIMERLPEMISLNKESRGQWWDVTKGISEKDFGNWLSGNTKDISENNLRALNTLKSQIDDIVGDAPESIKNQLLARTLEGAYSSLKESHTTRANSNFISDYQREQLNLKRKEAIDKTKKEGIKNINKTTLSFANDKEYMKKLGTYVDSNGKLLENQYGTWRDKDYKLTEFLFDSNGKLRNPVQGVDDKHRPYTSYYIGYNSYELSQAGDFYNSIVEGLSNLGFSESQINNMTKEDLESLFSSFKNDSRNDAAARQVYRFPLDNTATDYLKGKLISTMSNAELEEIRSIKGGKTEYGSKKPINKIFAEGEAANILFDPVDNEFRIQAGGKYYKLPDGMLSNEAYSKINNYLQPNKSFGGMSKLQGLQNAIEILENKESLSEQDYLRLVRYYDELSEIDSMFGTVGNDFVKYIGKKNINE